MIEIWVSDSGVLRSLNGEGTFELYGDDPAVTIGYTYAGVTTTVSPVMASVDLALCRLANIGSALARTGAVILER